MQTKDRYSLPRNRNLTPIETAPSFRSNLPVRRMHWAVQVAAEFWTWMALRDHGTDLSDRAVRAGYKARALVYIKMSRDLRKAMHDTL